jgi:hypothetical protein
MPELPVTLYANKTRFVITAAGGLFLAAACFFGASPSEPGVKYVMAGFWLLCCLAAVVLMLPSYSNLTVDEGGFSFRAGFRKPRRVEFDDVAEEGFFPASANSVDIVAWKYRPGAKPSSMWRKLNNRFFWEDSLPASYGGYSPEQMCGFLNTLLTRRVD